MLLKLNKIKIFNFKNACHILFIKGVLGRQFIF